MNIGSPEWLYSGIARITSASILPDIQQIVTHVFDETFGITTDRARLDDILRQALKMHRARTRTERMSAYGNLLASLLAFASEQEADPCDRIRCSLNDILCRFETYRSRGFRPKIVIFGGSFDPPTIGHVAVAKAVLASNLGIHEVWFMPANIYFGSKTLTDAQHRTTMCKLLESIDPRFKYFGYEIDNNLFSETIHTILDLTRSDLSRSHWLHYLVSTETANALTSWPRSDELKNAIDFIVLPRPGHQPNWNDPWFVLPPHRYLHETQGLVEVSSSEVRDLYRRGDFEEASKRVASPDIHTYIMDHKLYR